MNQIISFGKRVLTARRQLGLTQAELAERLDESMQSVSNWECERTRPWPKRQVEILAAILSFYQPAPTGRSRVCERI